MKNLPRYIILLSLCAIFLVFLFPLNISEAANFNSSIEGKEIASTNETADEVCNNTKRDVKGSVDEGCIISPKEVIPTGSCELQIVDGVPLNYGQLTLGQQSTERIVTIKNEGNANAKIMIKGSDWRGVLVEADSPSAKPGLSVVSGPEVTKVAMSPGVDYNDKNSLSKDGLELGQISGGQSIAIYFQFKSSIKDFGRSTTSPDFYQEVSIDLVCGGDESLKEFETKKDYNSLPRTPNTPSPLPIPYPNTNNKDSN